MIDLHMSVIQLNILLSIMLRLSLVLFMIPIFRTAKYPAYFKALTVVVIAFMMFPYVANRVSPLPWTNVGSAIWAVLGEVIFASLFAFAIQAVFAGFHLAGQMIGFQVGLAIAQVVDPQSGDQSAIISGLFSIVVTLTIFITGGHHIIIRAVFDSFSTIPIGGFHLGQSLYGPVLELSGRSFVLGLQVSAPVVVAILLTQLGMGLINKFAPQINILIAGFPLTLMIGFFFVGVSFLAWGDSMTHSMRMAYRFILGLIQ